MINFKKDDTSSNKHNSVESEEDFLGFIIIMGATILMLVYAVSLIGLPVCSK